MFKFPTYGTVFLFLKKLYGKKYSLAHKSSTTGDNVIWQKI